MSSQTTTVLYHAHCPDGAAAMYACWQHFGDRAQYLPVSYGQPMPDIPVEHNVTIVDFSYDADTLRALVSARLSRRLAGEILVTVLDHHASAQRDLAALQAQGLPGLSITFDLEESGATLAWKWWRYREQCAGASPPDHGGHAWRHGELEQQMPALFHYVRDRDLWQWQLKHSKAVSLAFTLIQKTPRMIQGFAKEFGTPEQFAALVARGQAMEAYSASLVQGQAHQVQWGLLGQDRVPIVNASVLISELGDVLCAAFPEAPFAASYCDQADGTRKWSLRSRKAAVDCSVIAKGFGGGGHPGAAGFVTSTGWLPPREKPVCT